MKIAGLMPVKDYDHGPSLGQLKKLTDETFVFYDNQDEWNDYANRVMLLTRAASKGYEWVVWLDADELLHDVCKADILNQVNFANKMGAIGVQYRVREMWDETHWRSDGIWGGKAKVVVQKNPMISPVVRWGPRHLNRLHAFPLQAGAMVETEKQLLHYGMSTPEKRTARFLKYKREDPSNKFQPGIGYDYLLDESGMVLQSINPCV